MSPRPASAEFAAAARDAVDRALPATMMPWARKGVYWAGGTLFVSGLGMSGYYLANLANVFGIGWPFAALLPAALDAGALVGVFMWVTGTGEIEEFGRRMARLLFGLSILGNALERALTFNAHPTDPEGIAGALLRTASLVRTLGLGTPLAGAAPVDGVTVGSSWVLLLISVGLGIVFPVLAYQMGHAVILARKSAEVPAAELGTVKASTAKPRKPAPVPAAIPPVPAAPFPVAAAALPRPPEVRVPAPAPTTPAVPVDVPAPGETKSSRADRYILDEWLTGNTPSGTDVEKAVDARAGSGLGRQRLRAMRQQHPGTEPTNGHAVPELIPTG